MATEPRYFTCCPFSNAGSGAGLPLAPPPVFPARQSRKRLIEQVAHGPDSGAGLDLRPVLEHDAVGAPAVAGIRKALQRFALRRQNRAAGPRSSRLSAVADQAGVPFPMDVPLRLSVTEILNAWNTVRTHAAAPGGAED